MGRRIWQGDFREVRSIKWMNFPCSFVGLENIVQCRYMSYCLGEHRLFTRSISPWWRRSAAMALAKSPNLRMSPIFWKVRWNLSKMATLKLVVKEILGSPCDLQPDFSLLATFLPLWPSAFSRLCSFSLKQTLFLVPLKNKPNFLVPSALNMSATTQCPTTRLSRELLFCTLDSTFENIISNVCLFWTGTFCTSWSATLPSSPTQALPNSHRFPKS